MAKGITIILQSYKVRVSVGGKQYTVGKFSTEKEASELYKKATDCKARADAAARRMFEKEMALSQVAKPAPTPSKTYEERLGQPQTSEPVKTPKPLTKQGKIAEELTKQLRVAAYMYSLLNFKGPEPILDWGLEKLEDYIVEHGDVLKDPEPQVLDKAFKRAEDIYAHTNYEGPAPELAWGIGRLERYLEEHRATEEDIEEYRSRIQRWIRDKKDRWGNPLIDGDSPQDPILGFDAKGDFVQPDDERNRLVVFKTLQEVEAYEAEAAKPVPVVEAYEAAAKPLPIYEYDFDKTATDSDGECYLIDNYETSVDPDYPEYMTWINRQGVAEFKTEY